GYLGGAAGRGLGQRQAHCMQIIRGHARRHLAACEEIGAPRTEKILLFFTGEAHWWFSLCRHGRTRAGHPRLAHSTTFGTTKKWSSVIGAFLMILSGMPPSVTTSGRFFISIGVTDVIGSMPSTFTSDNCSTKARMALS